MQEDEQTSEETGGQILAGTEKMISDPGETQDLLAVRDQCKHLVHDVVLALI